MSFPSQITICTCNFSSASPTWYALMVERSLLTVVVWAYCLSGMSLLQRILTCQMFGGIKRHKNLIINYMGSEWYKLNRTQCRGSGWWWRDRQSDAATGQDGQPNTHTITQTEILGVGAM